MEKLRRLWRSPIATAALFVLAAGLLLTSTIGGARAALTYESQFYSSQVQMYDIGVTLNENGRAVAWRNYIPNSDYDWDEYTDEGGSHIGPLLGNLLTDAEDESIVLGKTYDEVLTVTNSGTIDEYVRVTVYRYWIDENGNKVQALDPSLIDLHFVTGNGWEIDESSSTDERTVLYYGSVLPSGAVSPNFTDTLTIRGNEVLRSATTESRTEVRDGRTVTIVTTTYDYDGVLFQLDAEVDAVQTHNAEAAMWSAWGRDADMTKNVN